MVSPPRPPRRLAFTANVAGLTGSKLLALLSAMQLQAAHLGVFTETRSKDSPETLLARQPGAGALAGSWRFFHARGNGHTEGVAMAIAADSDLASFTPWTQLQSPRVLRLDGLLEALRSAAPWPRWAAGVHHRRLRPDGSIRAPPLLYGHPPPLPARGSPHHRRR